ncbi:hypothetical protein LP420_04625 [Massilia sp. B-10]|nr:hypothetical protein LP420_04625 [Massilia sp. B-10]
MIKACAALLKQRAPVDGRGAGSLRQPRPGGVAVTGWPCMRSWKTRPAIARNPWFELAGLSEQPDRQDVIREFQVEGGRR